MAILDIVFHIVNDFHIVAKGITSANLIFRLKVSVRCADDVFSI